MEREAAAKFIRLRPMNLLLIQKMFKVMLKSHLIVLKCQEMKINMALALTENCWMKIMNSLINLIH
jgi:hypothetical protein